jgi:hypothetical protein
MQDPVTAYSNAEYGIELMTFPDLEDMFKLETPIGSKNSPYVAVVNGSDPSTTQLGFLDADPEKDSKRSDS